MPVHYCESRGMILSDTSQCGTEVDGLLSDRYRRWCYDKGSFAYETDIEPMIEGCAPRIAEHGDFALGRHAATPRAVERRFPQPLACIPCHEIVLSTLFLLRRVSTCRKNGQMYEFLECLAQITPSISRKPCWDGARNHCLSALQDKPVHSGDFSAGIPAAASCVKKEGTIERQSDRMAAFSPAGRSL